MSASRELQEIEKLSDQFANFVGLCGPDGPWHPAKPYTDPSRIVSLAMSHSCLTKVTELRQLDI
jgi:hypothetical protein